VSPVRPGTPKSTVVGGLDGIDDQDRLVVLGVGNAEDDVIVGMTVHIKPGAVDRIERIR
jgi:hypothetical protein